MSDYKIQSQTFKILIHPTRLAILEVLRNGEQCVCHMEAMLDMRQAYISQHLMVLRDTGLVTDRRDGWNIFYRVTRPDLYEVIDAMNAFTGNENNPSASTTGMSAPKKTCPCPKCNPSSSPIRCDGNERITDENEKSISIQLNKV